MTIEAVLFDMGNTLIDFESKPGAALQREAATAVRDRLCERVGGEIPGVDGFLGLLAAAWHQVEDRHRERTSQPIVAEAVEQVLSDLGLPVEPGLLSALEAAHYQVIRDQIRLYPEAREVLSALRDRGVKLALISNTIWPTHFHREDLDRFELAAYFPCVIFSRDFGRMKPHPAIFEEALRVLSVVPENAMVVGDRLEADIRGARNAGCRAVLKFHPFTYPEHIPEDLRPDEEIRDLRELLTLLDREPGRAS